MNRHGTVTTKSLSIRHNGVPVRQVQFRRQNNIYTRQEVLNIGQELRQTMKDKNAEGSLQIAVYVNGLGWRSTKMQDIDTRDPTVFSFEDYDSTQKYPDNKYDDSEFTAVNIYFYKNPQAQGRGTDNNKSDCFYKCVRKILTKEDFFESDEKMKLFFRIKKTDGITVSDIARIEKHIKNDYGINVYGDYTYISTKKTNHFINLELKKGHYTLINEKPKTMNEKGGIPMFYRIRRTDEGMISFYSFIDGNDDFYSGSMPIKEWETHNKKLKFNTFTYFKGLELDEKQSRDMENMMKTLYTESNEKINMFKTGNYQTTSLHLFHTLNSGLKTEHIDQHEAEWIDEASIGGMLWCEKGFEGETFKYDFVSHYPSIMSSDKFRFPIKKGEFVKINNLDKITYGIYRVKISNVNERLFRLNPSNYYTHIDIFLAIKLNATIELINDDEPNALLYSPDKLIQGSRVFGEYINMLFELKKKKIEGSKALLNVLWGALCQKNLTKHYCHNNKVPEYSGTIIEIRSLSHPMHEDDNNNSFQFMTIDREHQYKTNYARLAPFLLSRGRSIINELLIPHIENVVRVHTDGFMITKKLNIETGTDLNCLKYEGCETVRIENVNKIIAYQLI
jgi:hypothetical protein